MPAIFLFNPCFLFNSRALILCAVVLCVLGALAPRAAAFETTTIMPAADAQHVALVPFTARLPDAVFGARDVCAPLLHQPSQNGPAYAMDQRARVVEQESAVSVVVGLKFALGGDYKRPGQSRSDQSRPAAHTQAGSSWGPSWGAWSMRPEGIGNSRVIAFTEYRRCRSQ